MAGPHTVVMESTSAPPPAPSSAEIAAVPRELIGTWESQAQGDALDVIVFVDPARFKRAEVLTQQRDSGLFEYSIASRGTVRVTGNELVLAPDWGTQTLKDPDGPGWERPIELVPVRFRWSVNGNELRLEGSTGEVVYARG
ncbi:hypothetical protein Lesp02_02040 [Lentzea sp. NBRC 105346]|nr:hypothetical protein Lesp02_02040 [Lentzea sp. NBRC 105346]